MYAPLQKNQSNDVCERMIQNQKYHKDKYLGMHCQYKIYGE
jgi:hypothetical protein